MKLPQRLAELLFPPKCVLCGTLLPNGTQDLCTHCRTHTPPFSVGHLKLPHLAQWTSLWYYEGEVRKSILLFKFHGRRSYAESYGRLLAQKLRDSAVEFDLLTWVPVSFLRRWRRGYDQDQLIAEAIGRELGITPIKLLTKHRHNRPQSLFSGAAQRRANVLGAYRCPDAELVKGKRVLLIDDILTTGATAGECARILLTAGAAKVLCATVAAASHNQKNR